MKKIIIIACAIILAGCNHRPATFSPGKPAYEPRHASGFAVYEVEGHGRKRDTESRLIRITDPWQGADGVEQWVFVSHDGAPTPEGFTGTVLREPARRIICMSSSYTAFLAELGVADHVVGVSGAEFITNPYIVARWRAGDVADVGYEANLDIERIASLQPDLILVYGISSDNGVLTGKLREMGVPYVFIGEYLEASPLGRAEWIVAVGELCGLAEEGAARFAEIESTYAELASRNADNGTGFANEGGADGRGRRPEVMFNAPYRDVWYVPGDDNYMVQLVRDAGGEYVCRGVAGRESRPIDIEEAYVAMARADYWINTNHYSTLAALLADNPRFAAAQPVQQGRVYNNNARVTAAGGSDFWESAVVRPDVVLRDLITILHPDGEPFADEASGTSVGALVGTSEADSAAVTPLYYYQKLE